MMNRHSPAFIAVESFDSIDEVLRTSGEWLSRETQPQLFDRLDWFRNTQEHVNLGGAPLIINARDGEWQGWLFLTRTARGKASALASWYTLAFRPIFTHSTPERARLRLVAAMADFVFAELGFGHITLSPIPGWDSSTEILTQGFQEAGWRCTVQPRFDNWVHDVVERDYAEYLLKRPGALRSTIKRKTAKSGLEFEICTAVTDKVWAEYQDIFDKSWKGDEGSIAFLRAMAETEAQAGALRLGIARLGGRAVATQLWTVENGTAIIHKLAYDEAVKSYSAGTLLSAHMFEHAINQDKVRHIDYGTGNNAYKRDWMSECQMLVTVEAFHPRTLMGAQQLGKNFLRRLAGRD